MESATLLQNKEKPCTAGLFLISISFNNTNFYCAEHIPTVFSCGILFGFSYHASSVSIHSGRPLCLRKGFASSPFLHKHLCASAKNILFSIFAPRQLHSDVQYAIMQEKIGVLSIPWSGKLCESFACVPANHLRR